MANPNALVDGVGDLSAPARAARAAEPTPQFLTVKFQGGRTGLLDMTSHRGVVWADVLQSLRQAHQPAYVEIDPKTNRITELLCPVNMTVAAVKPADDGVEVELIISQARHYLRRRHPDYQELLSLLQTAQKDRTPVLVTETLDSHEIIDVRPLAKTER